MGNNGVFIDKQDKKKDKKIKAKGVKSTTNPDENDVGGGKVLISKDLLTQFILFLIKSTKNSLHSKYNTKSISDYFYIYISDEELRQINRFKDINTTDEFLNLFISRGPFLEFLVRYFATNYLTKILNRYDLYEDELEERIKENLIEFATKVGQLAGHLSMIFYLAQEDKYTNVVHYALTEVSKILLNIDSPDANRELLKNASLDILEFLKEIGFKEEYNDDLNKYVVDEKYKKTVDVLNTIYQSGLESLNVDRRIQEKFGVKNVRKFIIDNVKKIQNYDFPSKFPTDTLIKVLEDKFITELAQSLLVNIKANFWRLAYRKAKELDLSEIDERFRKDFIKNKVSLYSGIFNSLIDEIIEEEEIKDYHLQELKRIFSELNIKEEQTKYVEKIQFYLKLVKEYKLENLKKDENTQKKFIKDYFLAFVDTIKSKPEILNISLKNKTYYFLIDYRKSSKEEIDKHYNPDDAPKPKKQPEPKQPTTTKLMYDYIPYIVSQGRKKLKEIEKEIEKINSYNFNLKIKGGIVMDKKELLKNELNELFNLLADYEKKISEVSLVIKEIKWKETLEVASERERIQREEYEKQLAILNTQKESIEKEINRKIELLKEIEKEENEIKKIKEEVDKSRKEIKNLENTVVSALTNISKEKDEIQGQIQAILQAQHQQQETIKLLQEQIQKQMQLLLQAQQQQQETIQTILQTQHQQQEMVKLQQEQTQKQIQLLLQAQQQQQETIQAILQTQHHQQEMISKERDNTNVTELVEKLSKELAEIREQIRQDRNSGLKEIKEIKDEVKKIDVNIKEIINKKIQKIDEEVGSVIEDRIKKMMEENVFKEYIPISVISEVLENYKQSVIESVNQIIFRSIFEIKDSLLEAVEESIERNLKKHRGIDF